jgi:hypothetical protein
LSDEREMSGTGRNNFQGGSFLTTDFADGHG